MSLILPDERIREIEVEACMADAFPVDGNLIEQRMFRNRAIARAQARHMAREIVGWIAKDAGENTYIHQLDLAESLEAWLRQEGVLPE